MAVDVHGSDGLGEISKRMNEDGTPLYLFPDHEKEKEEKGKYSIYLDEIDDR